jgi:hypothetical protein
MAANAGALAAQSNATGTNSDVVVHGASRSGPLTMSDMSAGSLDVNHWLKVDKIGMYIGGDRTPIDELSVSLHLDEVQFCFSVRYGNPAQYEKTYDHITDVKGRPWAQVLRHAQSIDGKASEFRSADVPFVLREDVKNKKGEVIAQAGDVLGHSVSVTGWKFFQRWLKQMAREGIDVQNDAVNMTIVQNYQKNDKGEWGVLDFKDHVVI